MYFHHAFLPADIPGREQKNRSLPARRCILSKEGEDFMLSCLFSGITTPLFKYLSIFAYIKQTINTRIWSKE